MYWSMSPEQALKMNERESNKKSTRQNKLGENLKNRTTQTEHRHGKYKVCKSEIIF